MNARVEKLAKDTYSIHHEVRDIHESVLEMRTSLSEIVALYKAILTRYGFGRLQEAGARPTARETGEGRAGPGEPGEDIIKALQREQGGRRTEGSPRSPRPQSRTVPPKAPGRQQPPSSAPEGASTLDELHRVSEEQRARDRLDSESLAERLASRSSREDRVTKVAHREMSRRDPFDRNGEGEFTKALPRKEVATKGGGANRKDDAWEAVPPPPSMEDRERGDDRGDRPRARLEDLLDPD